MTTAIDVTEPNAPADFEQLLGRVFDDRVRAWTAEAERTEKFPRELIEYLGAEGVFAAKWGDSEHPDVAKVIALALELGKRAGDACSLEGLCPGSSCEKNEKSKHS